MNKARPVISRGSGDFVVVAAGSGTPESCHFNCSYVWGHQLKGEFGIRIINTLTVDCIGESPRGSRILNTPCSGKIEDQCIDFWC